MARAIDSANEAGRTIQRQTEATRRTYAPLETTQKDQAIAHGDAQGPGPGETPGLDKSAWPSKRGSGHSSL